MAGVREIITFQFGNYANFIGTHWWNIQESGFTYDSASTIESELNHDILYREGTTHRGHVTYTPRVLCLDLKGSLKHLPKTGHLYSESVPANGATAWEPSHVQTINSEPIAKPEFQTDLAISPANTVAKDYKFSETVETWTDFMYTQYHPRSINLVPADYEWRPDEDSLDCYTAGTELWTTNREFQEDFDDKIRQYMEECNNCQGFQMLFDCSNGFAGVAVKCLEQLNDDYSKTVLAMPVFRPDRTKFANMDENQSDSMRMVNIALTYANLIDQSSVFVPLSTMSRAWRHTNDARRFGGFTYNEQNLYETSAILATYLDTMSLRWRTKSPTYSNYLSGFCSDLNNYGRKMVAAGLGLPFNMRENEDFIDCLDEYKGPLVTQLSPNSDPGTDRIVQSVCIRGIAGDRLKRPRKLASVKQMQMAAYKCDSVAEMLQLYYQCSNYASLAHVMSIEMGMPTRVPYPVSCLPDSSAINEHGFVREFVGSVSDGIDSIPVLATAQVSGKLADTLETLHREAERVKVAKMFRFKDTGMETDDYKETLEKLLDFKDVYDDMCQL